MLHCCSLSNFAKMINFLLTITVVAGIDPNLDPNRLITIEDAASHFQFTEFGLSRKNGKEVTSYQSKYLYLIYFIQRNYKYRSNKILFAWGGYQLGKSLGQPVTWANRSLGQLSLTQSKIGRLGKSLGQVTWATSVTWAMSVTWKGHLGK